MYRLRAKRTTGSNPPAELLFGELAFSDANKRLYVGRADGSPCTFESDLSLSPINEAIADLTTDLATLDASQTAQDTAIATINTALDGQADAIGLLSTNTEAALTTKLAAADVAPVALSGAYADLSGQPTIPAGFTYDQQSEPVGPAAGATWRERGSDGLIVRDWEWLGSVWCALDRTTLSGMVANAAATSYPAINFEAPRCLFIQCRIATNPAVNPATPFNSSNYRELYLSKNAGGVGNSVFAFRPMISNSQGVYISAMNYLNPMGAPFFTQTTVVGSPGTIYAPSVSWVYREVRA